MSSGTNFQILLRYHKTSNEGKGDTCFEYEVGQPSEDDYNQGEDTPSVELLPSPVYDDEGCLLQPPADESLNEENTEWQDAHNTPRHS